MGWVMLSLRKRFLRQEKSDLNYRLLRISAERRAMNREQSLDLKLAQNAKADWKAELSQAYQEGLTEVQQQRNEEGMDSADYQALLSQLSNQNQMDLQSESVFDAQIANIEEETKQKEDILDQEQEQIEAQVQAAAAEYGSVKEAVDQEIKETAIKLGTG